MQKMLMSVELCGSPSERLPAGVPVSLIVVAKTLRNAPSLCCRQMSPATHWESSVHGWGGFRYAKLTELSKQKPQNTRSWPWPGSIVGAFGLNEFWVCVPVVRLKVIGRQPMKDWFGVPQTGAAGAFGGGQSWLVGYAPLSAFVSGVHVKPLRVPPLHVPLAHTPGVPPTH